VVREEVEVDAAAEDVLAEVARGARFLERLLEALVLGPDLAVDVVVADRGAHAVPAMIIPSMRMCGL
jgi:hypothetical protein